jgi:hypothetical protein
LHFNLIYFLLTHLRHIFTFIPVPGDTTGQQYYLLSEYMYNTYSGYGYLCMYTDLNYVHYCNSPFAWIIPGLPSPTTAPTTSPTLPTEVPTDAPTATPTTAPTAASTAAPTTAPTTAPTSAPYVPTEAPTSTPTAAPTIYYSAIQYASNGQYLAPPSGYTSSSPVTLTITSVSSDTYTVSFLSVFSFLSAFYFFIMYIF